MKDAFSRRQIIRKPATESRTGVVASQSRLAAEAGARVLAGGGNAVDAAVATAFAVGVTEPWMSGLGGGGCLLIREARTARVTAVDFGMRAPAALDPADYPLAPGGADSDLFGWPAVAEGRNLRGATAVAVPGQVAGLALALETFGSLSWSQVMAPAIELAEDGLGLDWFSLHQIANAAGDLRRDPGSRALFLDPEGLPPHPVALARPLKNPALVRTLRHLAEGGAAEFYQGDLARTIAAEMQAAGGSLSREDLASYRATLREPMIVPRGAGRLFVLPELNGGPTLARALERVAVARPGGGLPDAAFFTAFAEAMLEAFDFRLRHLGDADEISAPSCTTHLSVVDGEGNMVALTQTLLSVFGARLMLPESGIMMNNGINWFDPRPGRPNSLGPNKRTLSNYVPVIGEWGERSFGIGASGGRKIIGAMAQLACFLGDFGLSLEAAMHVPRLDVSGPDRVAVDPVIGAEILAALERRFTVDRVRWGVAPNNFAIPSCVLRDGTVNFGAADPYHPWAEAVSQDEVS